MQTHINVPRETMKRESKYVTNGCILTDTSQNIVMLERAWGAHKEVSYHGQHRTICVRTYVSCISKIPALSIVAKDVVGLQVGDDDSLTKIKTY